MLVCFWSDVWIVLVVVDLWLVVVGVTVGHDRVLRLAWRYGVATIVLRTTWALAGQSVRPRPRERAAERAGVCHLCIRTAPPLGDLLGAFRELEDVLWFMYSTAVDLVLGPTLFREF